MVGMTLIEEVQARRLPPPKTCRAIRLAADVSQVRLAAELGIHRSTLIRWENGTQDPRGNAREQYARMLAELREATS
jgi:DNA-binding transcriptional regulator YiaG